MRIRLITTKQSRFWKSKFSLPGSRMEKTPRLRSAIAIAIDRARVGSSRFLRDALRGRRGVLVSLVLTFKRVLVFSAALPI